MSLVKWVDPRAMMNTFVEGRLLPSGNDAVPVIPLSALRGVVEGLNPLVEWAAEITKNWSTEDDAELQADVAMITKAHRLLAGLGEVEK